MLEIYTEYTPNPDSLKFVVNKMLLPNRSIDFREPENLEKSALAADLFQLDYVKGIFIANNFVTITKQGDLEWIEVVPEIKTRIKSFLATGETPVADLEEEAKVSAETNGNASSESGAEIDSKIRQVLEMYVRPAVEMDGGNIQFKSFEEGKVTVILQGSCSGCPSSTQTLKSGIEGLLARMVPEVKEVVAEAE